MEIKLQKRGNSYRKRIPNTILISLNIKADDSISLTQKDDKIIISKSKNKKISLKDRFDKYKGENLAQDFSWDNPVGEELC